MNLIVNLPKTKEEAMSQFKIWAKNSAFSERLATFKRKAREKRARDEGSASGQILEHLYNDNLSA